MKTLLACLVLLATTGVALAKDGPDFNLTVRIVSISHEQGYWANDERGYTYIIPIFTLRIDGDPIIYQMKGVEGPFARSRGAVQFATGSSYKAHWKNTAELEVEFTSPKGKDEIAKLIVVTSQADPNGAAGPRVYTKQQIVDLINQDLRKRSAEDGKAGYAEAVGDKLIVHSERTSAMRFHAVTGGADPAWTDALRKAGFATEVYTNDADQRFEFDLATRKEVTADATQVNKGQQ
jgi:hypothetical protein